MTWDGEGMITLAVDTSGPVCGVAVVRDHTVLFEQMAQNRMTHSVNLMPMIDTALAFSEITLRDVDRIGCVVGPGSFTGVRIGVSTAKGLSHGSGKPCVAVNALEAMAAGVDWFNGIVCPIQDARAGQVYGAAFQPGLLPQRLMEDQPIALSDYLRNLSLMGSRFLFMGDGMPVHRDAIREELGEAAIFAPPHLAFLRPSSVAVIASHAEKTLSYTELMPLYLRAPSAERNRKLVEAAHGT